MINLAPHENDAQWSVNWSYLDSGMTSQSQKLHVSQTHKGQKAILDLDTVKAILMDNTLIAQFVKFEYGTPLDTLIDTMEKWVVAVHKRFDPFEKVTEEVAETAPSLELAEAA